MTDEELMDLLDRRSEEALPALDAAYGPYCRAIAVNILQNREDAEECLNDAYLSLWNAIPPARPERLKAYIGATVRRLALRRRRRTAAVEALTLELSESLPDAAAVPDTCEAKALGGAISAFLRAQPPEIRSAFLRRYWYADSLKDVALRMGWSVSKTKSVLFRARKNLKTYLEREELWHE